MEFVRLKYANNKLINSDIKEHRDVINEYVEKRGYEYVGFIPTLFGPSGKTLEVDLIFRKPTEPKDEKHEKPAEVKPEPAKK